MAFLERFEFAKIWFHVKSERGKIIKLQQREALTSHFECFWSIAIHTHIDFDSQNKLWQENKQFFK